MTDGIAPPRRAEHGVALLVALALGCGSSSHADDAAGGASGGSANGSGGGRGGTGGSPGGAGPGGMAGTSGATSGGSSGFGTGGSSGAPQACFDVTTNHRPGSRLRPRTVVSSEGDRAWKGWHDSERGEDCFFATASDGSLRCLPESGYGTNGYYADAGCTEALFSMTTECNAELRYLRQAQPSCGPVTIFEPGAAYTEPMVYQLLGTTCAAVPTPAASMLTRRGAEVLPPEFVAATAGEWPAPTGRIRSYGQTATDGTLQLRRWLDRGLGIECLPEAMQGAGTRCFDRLRLEGIFFSDSSCSTSILGSYQRCPEDPMGRFGVVFSQETCETRVFDRGSAYGGTTYSRSGSECLLTIGTSYTFFQAGPEVPFTTFAEFTPNVLMDDPGRVKPRFLTTPDGGCWFDGWYDSELDIRCEFMPMPDGRYGCVPEIYIVPETTFSDASCTTQYPLIATNDCFGQAQPRYIATPNYSECGDPTREVRAVQEILVGSALPPLFTTSGGGCSSYVTSAEGTYLHLGPALDPSTLVGGSMMVE